MALPTIKINSAGSDSAASGAGPTTALSGSLAATHANTTVNITDAVDLSGVAIDGSAVLWVNSSSGRQFSKITNITGSSGAWVVTVAVAYANSETKTWGIGGKRATCAGSLHAFLDFAQGWTIDIQTGETITAEIIITPGASSTDGPAVVKSTTFTGTWGTQPIIQTATSAVAGLNISSANNLTIQGLELKCTVGSPVEGNSGILPRSGHSDYISVVDCNIHGWFRGIDGFNGTFFRVKDLIVENCEIHHNTNEGIECSPDCIRIYNSYIHDNTGYGVVGGNASTTTQVNALKGCTFANNGLAGAKLATLTSTEVIDCGFYVNGASGASDADRCGLRVGTSNGFSFMMCDNIFWNNGTGSGGSSGANLFTPASGIIKNNAYGGANQTLKASLNGVSTTIFTPFTYNEITLTADPRTSTTDALPNATAGGGVLVKNVGEKCANASPTQTAPDIGAIQTIPTAGGALGPNFRGGFVN